MTPPSVSVTATALRSLLSTGGLAGTWVFDPAGSTVGLRSRSMWGMAPVKGSFGKVIGEGTLSASGEVTGSIKVATDSITTKNTKRDKHLRSAAFFNSEVHPYIVFTADTLNAGPAGLVFNGSLQVAGRTRPISVPVQLSASGNELVQLDAEVTIDRSDFGLTWNQLGMASMKNVITVRAVFTRR
jgi:polyisoprenoid-binding protein YceI